MDKIIDNDMTDEWRSGYPKQPGWYDCLVDGREVRLRFRFCMTRGEYQWLDINGNKVNENCSVKWTGVGNIRY